MPKVGKVGKGNKSSGRARRTNNRHDTKRMTQRKPAPKGKDTMRGGFRPGWEK